MIRSYYIDYPQEHIEGQAHRYRCIFCKQETTAINGHLEGHLPTCEYRIQLAAAGFECLNSDAATPMTEADDYD